MPVSSKNTADITIILLSRVLNKIQLFKGWDDILLHQLTWNKKIGVLEFGSKDSNGPLLLKYK